MLLEQLDVIDISQRVSLEEFRGKRICVTGANGMLGSYLSESILRVAEYQGVIIQELVLFIHKSNMANYDFLRKSSLVKIESIANLNNYTPEIVFHAASPGSPKHFGNSDDMDHINSGVMSIFARKNLQNFIYISSGEVYGSPMPNPVSEDFMGEIDLSLSRSVYPKAKRKGELEIKELSEKFGFNSCSARLFHTFGPGVRESDGRSFSDFLWKAAKKDINGIGLRTEGQAIRTFLSLRDSAAALLLIACLPKSVGAINIGSSKPISVFDFARKVAELSRVPFVSTSGINSDIEESPFSIIVPDTSKMEKLGWKETLEISESIEITLNWIRKEILRNSK
jgi:nucleoside-diphosphate-sugar epimerase